MSLLRRIARRIVHEIRKASAPPPVANDSMQVVATERTLSDEHRWVSSVVVENLKDKAADLRGLLDASAEGRAEAARRHRDVAEYVRLGGRLPPP